MKWITNFLKAIAEFFSRKKPEPQIPQKPSEPVNQTPTVPAPEPKPKFKMHEFKKGQIGVDISHHNRRVDLELLAKNVDFIYMKATEGESFVSSKYVERAKKLKEMGTVAWGAYHYYRTNKGPAVQAEHFIKYVDVESGLPPVLDIEAINNNFKPHHRKDLQIFLNLVESKTKIRPIIYTGYYFAKDEFKPTEEFAKYKLWLPWYTSDFGRVKTPKPWDKITIWQYTEHGTIKGVDGNVDINRVV
ncbi:MAG: glycoside hydrolase family 25 protein [Pseudoalteromonas sp.]|uniref:glycoside hydrolase family 25 protein n=1 Tax=Pseudoalteromonas sp. TaxID=53249 RepID=UPI001DC7B014|nr:glycoside hydrolase family 25 protein [Pseudoalteromonas sp.]NRA76839.1 glycoside hydrolase family 25 protein [Pseudoalteromonas sp.]